MDLLAILNSVVKKIVGYIVWTQCMSICNFVLIQLTDFELDAKTRIFDQILLLLVGVNFSNKKIKNAFTSVFVG